jgi:low affinity Fe/Cu permease
VPRTSDKKNGSQASTRRPSGPAQRASCLLKLRRSPLGEVGRPWVFALALGTVVVVWAITGPMFHFSDTWQLMINTGTTIVTFLMGFLIQNSQNRDSAAIQVKLDELIRVSKTNNSFMRFGHLTEEELEEIKKKCEGRAKATMSPECQLLAATTQAAPPLFHNLSFCEWQM